VVGGGPARAPRGPPLTGESSVTMFLLVSSAAISLIATEPMVDISTYVRSDAAPLAPPVPNATARLTSGEGRHANAVSAPVAASRGEVATTPPRFTSGAIASARGSNTRTVK